MKPEAEQGKRLTLRGRIAAGLGEGSKFVRIPWVRRQLISKLSLDPFPGTLNVEVEDHACLQKLESLREKSGIKIIPEDPAYCVGKCFKVLIEGKIKGVIVFPMVRDYPPNKLEIITSEDVKKSLSVKEDDLLEIEVLFDT